MVVTVDQLWLALAIGTALPALVALVAKKVAQGWVKATLLMALSAVAGTLTTIQANGGTFDLREAALATAVAFGSGVISHFGLLKPIGITGSDGVIANAVPGGVGPSPQPAAPVQEPVTES